MINLRQSTEEIQERRRVTCPEQESVPLIAGVVECRTPGHVSWLGRSAALPRVSAGSGKGLPFSSHMPGSFVPKPRFFVCITKDDLKEKENKQ